ncbi:MAG: hypothetical protein DYG98_19100 [Haliscomenobacteraceae bacterium CHB4]|nr:hypothetical protein [Haliscomenobacteraceae bacterium CHB4]
MRKKLFLEKTPCDGRCLLRHSIKPPNGSIFGGAQSYAFGKSNEIGDRAGEGTTLNTISQIHKKRGDYDTALHKRVVRFKYRALVLSAGLYLFALGVLTWVYLP